MGGRKRVKRKGTEKRSERGREGCREIWREEGRRKNKPCMCVETEIYHYSYLNTVELPIVFNHRDDRVMCT